jgi:hypothetical protein
MDTPLPEDLIPTNTPEGEAKTGAAEGGGSAN